MTVKLSAHGLILFETAGVPVQTFASSDSTPSVGNGRAFDTAGTTTIVRFDDSTQGQVIAIRATGAITIQHNANIDLADGLDFAMVPGDVVALTRFDATNVFEEVSRKQLATTTARALATSGADVDVFAAAPPSIGQVLKATDATTATWQDESAGAGIGLNRQFVSFVRASDADEASIGDAEQIGLDILDTITIETRVRFAGLGVDQFLVSKQNTYNLGITSGGAIQFVYLLSAALITVTQAPAVAFVTGRWYDITASRSKASGLVSFYVDGVLEGSTVSNLGSSMDDSSDPFTIGGFNPGFNFHFDGDLAEVRVWNLIRSLAEIADSRFVQLNGDENGLAGYWKLNGGYEDATPSNNELIPASAPVFSVVPTDLPPTHEAVVLESGALGKPSVSAGSADPSSGGLVAYEGSLFHRFVATAGELWAKIGATSTDWAKVALLSVTNTFTKAQGTAKVALADAATVATDASLSNVFEVTLAGNRTLGLPTNLVAGFQYTWIVKQDGTGSRTLAFNAVFKFEGGTAPTLTTTASAVDVITGAYDGTNLLCSFLLDVK